jgi:hypothetical protein
MQSRYNVNISGGGLSISGSKTRETDDAQGLAPVIPAGKTVTSWVKTDSDTADCNLPSGHGYASGNFDVYWDGGRRYGVPGTVTSDALALDGGTGDDFPASATVGVVVCRQVQVNVAIDGDALALLGIKAHYADRNATTPAGITFKDAGDADIAHLDLQANRPVVIDVEGGDDNPFTGNPITYALASNGSAVAEVTIQIVKAGDSTP